MDDLVARLRACLDTDERVALAVGPPECQRWKQPDPEREYGRIEDGLGNVVTYDESSPTESQAAHIARHDPARVLRWVKAAREILRRHEPIRVLDGWACDDSFVSAELKQYEEWPCRDVSSLMSVYGDTEEAG